jgi:hypothetical protein
MQFEVHVLIICMNYLHVLSSVATHGHFTSHQKGTYVAHRGITQTVQDSHGATRATDAVVFMAWP